MAASSFGPGQGFQIGGRGASGGLSPFSSRPRRCTMERSGRPRGLAMAVYVGERTSDGARVLVDGRPLDPRQDLKAISANGFEWTYEGAEPAQLALALLAHHLGDGARALRLHQAFMRQVVANLDNEWTLTGEDIDAALGRLEPAGTGGHR